MTNKSPEFSPDKNTEVPKSTRINNFIKSVVLASSLTIAQGALAGTNQIIGYNGTAVTAEGANTSMGFDGADVGKPRANDQIEGYNGQTVTAEGANKMPSYLKVEGLDGLDVGKPRANEVLNSQYPAPVRIKNDSGNDQIVGYNGTTTGREDAKPGAPGNFKSIGLDGADVGKPTE